jgi:hypothetical protein
MSRIGDFVRGTAGDRARNGSVMMMMLVIVGRDGEASAVVVIAVAEEEDSRRFVLKGRSGRTEAPDRKSSAASFPYMTSLDTHLDLQPNPAFNDLYSGLRKTLRRLVVSLFLEPSSNVSERSLCLPNNQLLRSSRSSALLHEHGSVAAK